MIVISNSSPIIALAEIQRIDIFQNLFEKIYIPQEVFEEVVISNPHLNQRGQIEEMINNVIEVLEAETNYEFKRIIGAGERGLLNLAIQKQADILIMDEKRARKEARELGFETISTSVLLKRAEQEKLITSFLDMKSQLEKSKIFLPEY